MTKKVFFASCAKTVFTLAAVVMMSLAFASCSKDDDEKFTNTVTLGDVESSIFGARYIDEGNGNYSLFLYLSADGGKAVQISLNKELHMNGTPIDLKKKEERDYDGKRFWAVAYYENGIGQIDTSGYPADGANAFKEGTLIVTGDLAGTINIKLENGRVTREGGNDSIFNISYSGTVKRN